MRIAFLLFGLFTTVFFAQAQQFVSQPPGNNNTGSPLTGNGSVRKQQQIYSPSDMGLMGQKGYITALHLRAGTANSGNMNINSLKIRLGHTSDTSFTSVSFYSGVRTVLDRTSFVLSQAVISGGYIIIPLDTPFYFDSDSSLLVEISSASVVNGVQSSAFKKHGRRLFSTLASSSTGVIDSMQWTLGFSLMVFPDYDVRVDSLLSPASPVKADSGYAVSLKFRNFGTDTLRALQLHYQYNQGNIVTENWAGNLLLGSGANFIFLTPLVPTNAFEGRLKVWSSMPNGEMDQQPQNDTLEKSLCVSLANVTRTIGGPNADYPDISTAFADLQCRGMAGPVRLLLNNGVYNHPLTIPIIPGQSDINTLTIASASGISDSVIFRTSGAPTLSLSGRSGVILSRLTFYRIGVQFSTLGNVNIINSNHIRFEYCQFLLDRNTNPGSWQTQRNFTIFQGNHLTLIGNKIEHGYYGIQVFDHFGSYNQHLRIDSNFFIHQITGSLFLLRSQQIHVGNNLFIPDSSITGPEGYFRIQNSLGCTISANYFRGIFNQTILILQQIGAEPGQQNLIINNKISGSFTGDGVLIGFSTSIVNSPFLSQFVFASNSINITLTHEARQHLEIISIAGATPTGISYARSQIINNAFKVRGTYPGTGMLIGYSGIDSVLDVRHNFYDHDLGMHAVKGGNPAVDYPTLQSFQQAGKDSASESGWINYRREDLFPVSSVLDNKGMPLTNVPGDFIGQLRSAQRPDIGAYEYSGVYHPELIADFFADTDTIRNRSLILQVQDSLQTSGTRLWYKRHRDSAWVFTTGSQVVANQFRMTLDLQQLRGRTKPGDTVYYYLTATNTLGQSNSLPMGGSEQLPPVEPAYFVFGQSFAGIYTIGQGMGRDFSTISAAMQALRGSLIGDTTIFLLCDTSYPQDTFPIIVHRSYLSDSSKIVQLQPADSIRIHFQLPANNVNSFFILENTHNFILNGRSPDGFSGQIQFTDAGTSNSSLFFFNSSDSAGNLNSGIINCNIKASAPVNQKTAINVLSGAAHLRMHNTLISGNYIEGSARGIFITGGTNLKITENVIGPEDSMPGNMWSGISTTSTTNTLIRSNIVRNLVTTGIEILGIAVRQRNLSATISRNLIYNLRTIDTVINGLAVNGILVHCENEVQIIGNEIHGITAKQKLSGSGPYIRLVGIEVRQFMFPMHKIYHNSVYLTGNYTNNNQSIRVMALAYYNQNAPVMAIDIRNNIFVNTASSTRVPAEVSIYGLNHYNIGNEDILINHNVYVYEPGPSTAMAIAFTPNTIPYPDFNGWRMAHQIAGRQNETHSTATYAPNTRYFEDYPNIYPTIALSRIVNGRATPLPYPAEILRDKNMLDRPAFGETTPDPGAYEVVSDTILDIQPPQMNSVWMSLPPVGCAEDVRVIFVNLHDESSIDSVWLIANCNNKLNEKLLMQFVSGIGDSSIWSVAIPVDSIDRWCFSLIIAKDQHNNQGLFSGPDYHDLYIHPDLTRDTSFVSNQPITLFPKAPLQYTIGFSELLFNSNGNNTGNIAPHLPSIIFGAIEIANWGTDTVDLSGVSIRNYQYQVKFVFPQGTRLPPSTVVVVASQGSPASPQDLYFVTSLIGNVFGSSTGLALHSPLGYLIDAISLSGFVFNPNTNITNPDWWIDSVTINTATTAGIQLTGLDLNNARNWKNYDDLPGSLGYFHQGLVTRQSVQPVWSGAGSGTGWKVPVINTGGGIYQYVLNLSSGNCTESDTLTLRLSGSGNTDFIRPFISSVTPSSNYFDGCPGSARYIDLEAVDSAWGSGISELHVLIEDAFGNNQRVVVPRISGNDSAGIYRFVIQEPYPAGVLLYRAFAVDSNNLSSDTIKLPFVIGEPLKVSIVGDTTQVMGSSTVLRTQCRLPARVGIQLTEVIFRFEPNNHGSQPLSTLPPGFPAVLGNDNDVIEITNYSSDTVATHDIYLRIFRGNTHFQVINYRLPQVFLAPGTQLFLISNSGINDTANRVYYIGNTNVGLITSNTEVGVLLYDERVDQVISAVTYNGYNFQAVQQVPVSIWSGSVLLTATECGIARIASKPANQLSWRVSSPSFQTNLGTAPSLLIPIPVQWSINGVVSGVNDSLLLQLNQTTQVMAELIGYNCSARDSVVVNVVAPIINLRMLQILSPDTGSNTPNTPVSVQFMNGGNVSIANVPLKYRINNGAYIQETFSGPLLPGDTALYTFSTPWNPPAGGQHTVCIMSSVSGDVIPGDDTLCLRAGGFPVFPDVRLTELLSPHPDSLHQQPTAVQIRLKNEGDISLQLFTLSYKINDSLQAIENFAYHLPPDDSVLFTFGQYWTPVATGSVNLCVTVYVNNDVDTSDNFVCVPLNASVGIEDLSMNKPALFQVYPNPTNEKIMLEFNTPMLLKRVILRGMAGKVVLESEPNGIVKNYRMSLEQLSEGVYILEAEVDNQKIYHRIMLQR